jgi:hypothetical protein
MSGGIHVAYPNGTITGRFSALTKAQLRNLNRALQQDVLREPKRLILCVGTNQLVKYVWAGPFQIGEPAPNGRAIYVNSASTGQLMATLSFPLSGTRRQELGEKIVNWVNDRHAEWCLVRGTPNARTIWTDGKWTKRKTA